MDEIALSIKRLNQNVQSIRTLQGNITCSDDVKTLVTQVCEQQKEIQAILGTLRQDFNTKKQDVDALRKEFQNLEINAEKKVHRRSIIENGAIFIISLWWVYLMAEKYVFP